MGVPFLGRLPLSLAIREASDAGSRPRPADGAEAEAFAAIAGETVGGCHALIAAEGELPCR